jgi:hypothetical protein
MSRVSVALRPTPTTSNSGMEETIVSEGGVGASELVSPGRPAGEASSGRLRAGAVILRIRFVPIFVTMDKGRSTS